MKLYLLSLVILLALLIQSHALIKLPSYFGDDMVLQRDSRQCFKGEATPGSVVSVQLRRQTWTASTDSTGNFNLCFQTGSVVKNGFKVKFTEKDTTSGDTLHTITLSNVLFGDVYWFVGQSNIQMTVGMAFNATAEIAAANYPNIRFFTSTLSYSSTEQRYAPHELSKPWNAANSTVVGGPNWKYTSAVGYYFARDLYNALGGKVPIGCVFTSYTGTPIEAWISPEALSKCPTSAPQSGPQKQNSVLYNAMAAPLFSMDKKAIVYWQIEGNLYNTTVYKCHFENLIREYRQKSHSNNKLPFVYLQAGPLFRNATGAQLFSDARIAQDSISEPNTYRVLTMDLGDRQTDLSTLTGADLAAAQALYVLFGIHQRNKLPVGVRTSNMVLAKLYGKTLNVQEASIAKITSKRRGNTFTARLKIADASQLQFRSTVDCISCCGASGNDNAIQLQVQNGSWVKPTSVTLTGSSFVNVSLEGAENPVAIRYAYDDYPQCLLYNEANLPMPQFVKAL